MTKEKIDQMIKQWRVELYDTEAFNAENGYAFDYESLAIGFFVAKGATPDDSYNLYQECIKRDCF